MTAATRSPAFTTQSADGTFTGTGTLLTFMLRRDRIRFPAWTLGLSALMGYFVSALATVYSTDDELQAVASFAASPIGALFGGPGYGFEALTLEKFLVGQYGLYILLGAGLMNLLTVVRHTRAEERAGRAELIRSNVVGRHAPLTAALVLAAAMNVIVMILVAGVMVGAGYDASGALVFGASIGATGLSFAGITAVAVQVSAFPRVASGIAGVALGIAFGLRGLGDMVGPHGSWLSWLSPLGWGQQTAPYVLDRWWPLGLSVLLSAATIAVGYRLSGQRDLDAGLLPPRPGPPSAAPWLRSIDALSFRLQRTSIIGWSIALLASGAAYGAFAQPLLETFDDAPAQLAEMLAGGSGDLLSGFLSIMALLMGLLVAIYVVLAVQAVRNEETEGRAEAVLATAVSRRGWIGAQAAVTAAGSAWLLLIAGVGSALGAVLSTGDHTLFGQVLLGHVAYLPAVWLVLAIALLLYGIRPRLVPVAWIVIVYGGFVGFFASLLDLTGAALAISPFEHVGRYPLESLSTVGPIVLTALALCCYAASTAAFGRRDIITT